ncbi:MAG: hypothetical protein P8125_11800 [Gemmatimonadota bacterium]
MRAEFASASGDPVAYRIRGALIALRRGEAENVRIIRSTTGFETANSGAVDESAGPKI